MEKSIIGVSLFHCLDGCDAFESHDYKKAVYIILGYDMHGKKDVLGM